MYLYACMLARTAQTQGSYLLVRVDVGRSSVDDEEQPEELVAALHNDVLPHASADERLAAPVRLVQ